MRQAEWLKPLFPCTLHLRTVNFYFRPSLPPPMSPKSPMETQDITVKGARVHNLKEVDLILPKNHLICFTGVSGSGKSSMAFDTLYAEGQRRYVASLSAYARQFLGQLEKPDVDLISGLAPTISIAQKSAGHNPRSTVGTITEIYGGSGAQRGIHRTF